MNVNSASLVLVGGMPRSGTTLLARIIAEEFQIPFSPETHYFSGAYRNGELSTEQLPIEVMEEPRVAAAYGKIQGQPKSIKTFRALLRNILGEFPIIGEKTPAHLTSFDEILSQDGKVICLVIQRNFFDVTESLKKVHWNKEFFGQNLRRCARYHRITYSAQKKFPERMVVVDYRTLCEDTDRLLTVLSAKLPRGTYNGKQHLFDPELEPWKRDALHAPEARYRLVPTNRILPWLVANLTEWVCRILWPLTFEEMK
jgi:hypothetical protein